MMNLFKFHNKSQELTGYNQQYMIKNKYRDKSWYMNGELHREDGPAIEYSNGTKRWLLNGERHRINGPAIEDKNGDKRWYINGKRHREDGPAVEWANGYKAWYLNDVKYSEKEWKTKLGK